jgi:hypothetical protein
MTREYRIVYMHSHKCSESCMYAYIHAYMLICVHAVEDSYDTHTMSMYACMYAYMHDSLHLVRTRTRRFICIHTPKDWYTHLIITCIHTLEYSYTPHNTHTHTHTTPHITHTHTHNRTEISAYTHANRRRYPQRHLQNRVLSQVWSEVSWRAARHRPHFSEFSYTYIQYWYTRIMSYAYTIDDTKTWYMRHETWYMIHDTWYMIHDTWYMTHTILIYTHYVICIYAVGYLRTQCKTYMQS